MKRGLGVIVLLAIGGLIACSAAEREIQDPVPGEGTAPTPSANWNGRSGAGDAGAAKKETCARDLEFGALKTSSATCVNNEKVAYAKTVVEYACDVGGPVTVKFGPQTFEGDIQGTYIRLKNVETFNPGPPTETNPKCQWETTQTIEGDLVKGTLKYRYTEKILTKGLCRATPCVTDASLAVKGSDERRTLQ